MNRHILGLCAPKVAGVSVCLRNLALQGSLCDRRCRIGLYMAITFYGSDLAFFG